MEATPRQVRLLWALEAFAVALFLYLLGYGIARKTHVLLWTSGVNRGHREMAVEASPGRGGAAFLEDLFRPLIEAELWVHETFPADPPP